LLAENHPAEIENHDGKQVGRPAKKMEQQIGDQRTNAPDGIVYFTGTARLRESRIARVVAEECEPENKRQGAKDPQRAFPQGRDELLGQI
jgi:hypothetical protein